MKIIFYSLITFLSMSYNAFAQNQVDTLKALSYFPIQIGNQWQYRVTSSYFTSDTSYYTIIITGDTLLQNGKCYYEFYDSGNYSDYLRVDTTELAVYKYEPDPFYSDSELVYYELTKPDTINPLAYFIFHDTTFGKVGNLPLYRSQNIYWWTDWNVFHYRYLAQDFGLASMVTQYQMLGLTYYNLIAAQIDSSTYGQFITSINHFEIINNFILYQNYPNPFNQSTTIKFELSKKENIKIEIFNLLGQKIETLLKEQLPAGLHEIDFNADELASGVYLYRIESGNYQQIRKMIVLK